MHCERLERHISNLSELTDRGSSKQPPSILKNATSQKSNKDHINEFQRKEDRSHILENSKPIIISDDEEAIDERKTEKLKAVDPNCPEGNQLSDKT